MLFLLLYIRNSFVYKCNALEYSKVRKLLVPSLGKGRGLGQEGHLMENIFAQTDVRFHLSYIISYLSRPS